MDDGVAQDAVDELTDPERGRRPGELDTGAQDEPWRTPFASGAVRIPEPVLPPAPPRRGPLDTLLVALPLGAALVSAGVVAVAYDGVRGLRGAVIVAGAAAGWLGMLAEVRRAGRGSDLRPVGIALLALAALFLLASPFLYGPIPAFLGLVMFGAAFMAWRSVSRRRAADERAVSGRENVVTTHRLAVEWNRVREALRTPGSRAERSLGAPCLDEPHRVRTVDPGTRAEVLRDLGVEVPRNGWVVVDNSGSAICTAAPGALEAWLATWPEASGPRTAPTRPVRSRLRRR